MNNPNAMTPEMQHLAGWYAGHKFPDMSYIAECTSSTSVDDRGVILQCRFAVHNEVATQIGHVCYAADAPGDGWSFEVRACTAHTIEPYEDGTGTVSRNGKFRRVKLLCPVCDRPRGERLIRMADEPWYKQAALLEGVQS